MFHLEILGCFQCDGKTLPLDGGIYKMEATIRRIRPIKKSGQSHLPYFKN